MKRIYFWIRLLLSGGLIVFLFYTIDLQEISAVVARANFSYVFIALALGMVDRVLMAYKWNILLRAKEIQISLPTTTVTYLSTTFLGLFLPATVGGDALRAYAVTKGGYKIGDVVSSIVVERVLGIMALMTFVLGSISLSVVVFGQSFFDNIWRLFWIILVVFVAVSAVLFLSLNESFLHRLTLLLGRWKISARGHKLLRKLKEIYWSYLSYRDNKLQLFTFLLLSFVENLFPILWSYCLSLAFNIQVPLLYFFILVPIVLVLRRLPISIDGTGIHEGTFVYFLSLIGVVKSEALLLGIATHALAIAIVLPGGILYAFSGLDVGRGKKIDGRIAFQGSIDVQTDNATSK